MAHGVYSIMAHCPLPLANFYFINVCKLALNNPLTCFTKGFYRVLGGLGLLVRNTIHSAVSALPYDIA